MKGLHTFEKMLNLCVIEGMQIEWQQWVVFHLLIKFRMDRSVKTF